MKKFKRAVAFLLAATMVVGFAGCAKNTTTGSVAEPEGDVSFPETLSIFCRKGGSLTDDMADYNEILSFKLLEEATGTHIEWTIPPGTGFEEKFNLMIAGGTLTDIIVAPWNTKGVEQYIEDKVLFDMSPYVEKYMPNLMAFSKENPELARGYIYDGGKVYYTPYIRQDEKLNVFYGPVIRTDWLKKLNLDVPKNSEELYNVLKAFKTGDPNGNGAADEIPMSVVGSKGDLSINALMYMFGTKNEFYVKDGQVKYGIMEPEFEEALKYTVKLYSEGLIDTDYILQDRTALVGKITDNKVGFAYEYQPTQIMNQMAEEDPSFKFEGIPNFENPDGAKRTMSNAYTSSIVSAAAAISTACKDPFGAMKWLDFLYGEEGHMIANFGKEGDTYEMVDGVPTFTEKITNNQDGRSRSKVWGDNFLTYNSYFPARQDWNSYGQYLSDFGRSAIETWSDGVVTDMNLPTLTFDEESKEKIVNTFTPIETYVAEQVDKIILGQVSIDKLPEIRSEIEKRGISEIIKLYQAAYDAYSSKDIGF